jgi:hypothetical protein
MANNIKDIIKNTKNIFMTDSALVSLMEFERVIDQLDIYVFKNWKQGELTEGPNYEKYFIANIYLFSFIADLFILDVTKYFFHFI